jgi:hypothetical protein
VPERAARVKPRKGVDDFHGFLAAMRLITGEPPKSSTLRRRQAQRISGELLYYRDSTRDGTGDVANPTLIGQGEWNAFRHVFSGGNGVIYAVDREGRLLLYRDKTQDGTGDVANPLVIGQGGWQNMRFLFSGGTVRGTRILYAVDEAGRLLFFRDKTQNGTGDVANPSVIGQGGWQNMRFLFSGGNGILYAVVG